MLLNQILNCCMSVQALFTVPVIALFDSVALCSKSSQIPHLRAVSSKSCQTYSLAKCRIGCSFHSILFGRGGRGIAWRKYAPACKLQFLTVLTEKMCRCVVTCRNRCAYNKSEWIVFQKGVCTPWVE